MGQFLGDGRSSFLNGYAAKFDSQGNVVEQGLYDHDELKTAMTP